MQVHSTTHIQISSAVWPLVWKCQPKCGLSYVYNAGLHYHFVKIYGIRLKICDNTVRVLVLGSIVCVYFFFSFPNAVSPFLCTAWHNLHRCMELSVSHFLEPWVPHMLISTLFQTLAYNKGHALSLRQDSDSNVQTGTLLVLASVACNREGASRVTGLTG